jgi:hypothetical protein
MGLHRDEIRGNEARDFIVRVRLGLQPSASPSSWRCAEINQERAIRVLGFRKRRVNIRSVPWDGHLRLLSSIYTVGAVQGWASRWWMSTA